MRGSAAPDVLAPLYTGMLLDVQALRARRIAAHGDTTAIDIVVAMIVKAR